MKNVVVLGGGTGGSLIANKLVRVLDGSEWTVTVVDRDDVHVYQPGLLFLPFGSYREDEIRRPRGAQLAREVAYLVDEVDRVDPEARTVALKGGTRLAYDILVIATGTDIYPEETEGLKGTLWHRDVFDFYTLAGASALRRRLDAFERGRIVVNIVDLPIKCPVAPLEFAFLTDAFFEERGRRGDVEIAYVTPLDGAFTKPTASRILGTMMGQKNIRVVPNFNAASVDNERRILASFDGREEPFDLLVTIPLHGGSAAIRTSGIGDDFGFVPTDKHTLQSLSWPEVFVIGDATDLPSSKAGAVAHYQGDVLLPNILRFIAGEPLAGGFDGHSTCFVETGHGKAMLLDFNYETEPLPGRFPLPGIGPMTLLEESAANHWGKLAFKWAYWNLLVKGKELPLDHRMTRFGKWS